MLSFWVYMLRCSDGTYYVGHTDDLDLRIAKHQSGEFKGYTSHRLPLELVFAAEAPSRDDAILREWQLKGWSRGKKEALIASDWRRVCRLSRGPDRET